MNSSALQQVAISPARNARSVQSIKFLLLPGQVLHGHRVRRGIVLRFANGPLLADRHIKLLQAIRKCWLAALEAVAVASRLERLAVLVIALLLLARSLFWRRTASEHQHDKKITHHGASLLFVNGSHLHPSRGGSVSCSGIFFDNHCQVMSTIVDGL